MVDLGCERCERTLWSQTVRTCRELLQSIGALWSFLDTPEIELTEIAAERALRLSVRHRKISHRVQPRADGISRSRQLTVTATRRQQVRDV
jgi:transposase